MGDRIEAPRVGAVYRGRGGEREVVEVLRAGALFEVVWRRPGRPATSRAWYQTWKDWLRTADLVADPSAEPSPERSATPP